MREIARREVRNENDKKIRGKELKMIYMKNHALFLTGFSEICIDRCEIFIHIKPFFATCFTRKAGVKYTGVE